MDKKGIFDKVIGITADVCMVEKDDIINGKTASTMQLDEPIDIRDDEEKAEDGSLPKMVSMFQVGAPLGYLKKYHRC